MRQFNDKLLLCVFSLYIEEAWAKRDLEHAPSVTTAALSRKAALVGVVKLEDIRTWDQNISGVLERSGSATDVFDQVTVGYAVKSLKANSSRRTNVAAFIPIIIQ